MLVQILLNATKAVYYAIILDIQIIIIKKIIIFSNNINIIV